MKLKPILLKTGDILKTGSTSDGKWFFGKEGFGCFINNDEDIIQHHIYLIDLEPEIKKGDWFITNNAPQQCLKVRSGSYLADDYPYEIKNSFNGETQHHSRHWNGVIVASTDKLTIGREHNDTVPFPKMRDKYVPQLSEQAIKTLINYYNQHGKMPEFVEVQLIPLQNYVRERMVVAGFNVDKTKFTKHLQLNSQGTIDITIPEERMYSSQEVRRKIINFYLEEDHWDEDDVENWLNKNLE
jgi:hypothetical protein